MIHHAHIKVLRDHIAPSGLGLKRPNEAAVVELLKRTGDLELAQIAADMEPRPAWVTEIIGEAGQVPSW